ncbi:Hematopoietic progenitor cell antigen CD34 [Tupaia chinensis]|uniref:Hematopoietic progenitor cell antigen CD34 n=1 Tax=Tupaia chinensis TaxID=246437 RepID=L8Y6X1_TUPCH|nr:Hematopoietic progenitor cell antigen CD34 [Tupaia chinensis]
MEVFDLVHVFGKHGKDTGPQMRSGTQDAVGLDHTLPAELAALRIHKYGQLLIAIESSIPGISSAVPTSVSNQKTASPSALGGISSYPVPQNSSETTTTISDTAVNFSDLRGLRIHDFTEQNVASHQSYSQKTLIVVVTLGILLAVFGTTGYFLMSHHSWSPTGERLDEDPYYTENGRGQAYSSGPGVSSEAQGKASVNQGAQENRTGQATSRNGHSARQHVADTKL